MWGDVQAVCFFVVFTLCGGAHLLLVSSVDVLQVMLQVPKELEMFRDTHEEFKVRWGATLRIVY